MECYLYHYRGPSTISGRTVPAYYQHLQGQDSSLCWRKQTCVRKTRFCPTLSQDFASNKIELMVVSWHNTGEFFFPKKIWLKEKADKLWHMWGFKSLDICTSWPAGVFSFKWALCSSTVNPYYPTWIWSGTLMLIIIQILFLLTLHSIHICTRHSGFEFYSCEIV